VPPVAAGSVPYDKGAHDALSNLTVYLPEVVELLPRIAPYLGSRFDHRGYAAATKGLLALVSDLLQQMGEGGTDGEDTDTDDGDDTDE